MVGRTKTHPERGPKGTYTYYVCTHDRTNPRHVAQAPDHPGTVAARQDLILTALRGGLDIYAFGPGRKERLRELLPAGADDQQARTDAQAAALDAWIKQIETAQDNLVHDLATLPTDPAARPYGPSSTPTSLSCIDLVDLLPGNVHRHRHRRHPRRGHRPAQPRRRQPHRHRTSPARHNPDQHELLGRIHSPPYSAQSWAQLPVSPPTQSHQPREPLWPLTSALSGRVGFDSLLLIRRGPATESR
jgi:hypothetical protein